MSVPVSPASPLKAISVCLLSCLVLSSEALRIVAPRMAAFEEAMMVKSLPVRPSRASLWMTMVSGDNSNERVHASDSHLGSVFCRS